MMINSDKVINVIEKLFPELSKRECEFLFLYSMPSTHSILEKQMKVSVNTVKTFHERVKVKLNIDNSLELRLVLKTRLDFFFISQALSA